ncbi:hypothetical protein [Streptomyces ochraceiscleroticus]|uniref:Secreted protein n=1 Tax=Streptomyces ochraceiscleroticus TaxID=47761 RepID=A0ABW1MLF3_9ACTN|nr:hypothetical protein [Streptomyces ochraceiscleroticus]
MIRLLLAVSVTGPALHQCAHHFLKATDQEACHRPRVRRRAVGMLAQGSARQGGAVRSQHFAEGRGGAL